MAAETRQTVFAEVEEAIAEIRAGRMVVVVDDEDRENEGDLTLAAEHVTPEAINFMARISAMASSPSANIVWRASAAIIPPPQPAG